MVIYFFKNYSSVICFTLICCFRKVKADSENFSSASVCVKLAVAILGTFGIHFGMSFQDSLSRLSANILSLCNYRYDPGCIAGF